MAVKLQLETLGSSGVPTAHTRLKGMSACQHTEQLSLVNEFRRTVSGRVQPDGKSVVCGRCGDRWRFVDRIHLPEWLRAELIRRALG